MEHSSHISLYPSPPIQISDEEFHAFHYNDRRLYQILIDDLDRDPSQSMNVMAFWIWLEREVCVKVNLIRALVDLPHNLINEVADESVICLLSCQFEHFPVPEVSYELAVLPNLAYPNVAAKKLSLQDFHSNRLSLLLSVNKIVKDVCVRAFNHNFPRKTRVGFPNFPGQTSISRSKGKGVETFAMNNFRKPNNFGFPVFHQPLAGGIFFGEIPASLEAMNKQEAVIPSFPVAHARRPQPYNPSSNVSVHHTVVNKEDSDNFFPDDRTIFITFSKGYPVSEVEVRDFFTRRFGDCVEAIFMQDVPRYQQALYARVIVRSAAITDMIVQGGRAKYNIFGKHVWARKFVKKNK